MTAAVQPTAITEGGLYPVYNEVKYHAHPTSLSHSGAKVLLDRPSKFAYQRANPVHRDVFDFGSAAHALVLGMPVDELLEVVDADSWRTNAAKEARDAARARGVAPVLTSEWQQISDMAAALLADPFASSVLAGGDREVSAFCEDPETGVMRRARFDHLTDDLVTDYKTAADASDESFSKAAANYGYAMQHAWYVDILADLDHPVRSLLFVVQEKEPPYDVNVCELTFNAVTWGRDRNRVALQRFRDCTESGKWPGFTPEVSPIDLPDWAYRKAIA